MHKIKCISAKEYYINICATKTTYFPNNHTNKLVLPNKLYFFLETASAYLYEELITSIFIHNKL